jgi:hypothetical protein
VREISDEISSKQIDCLALEEGLKNETEERDVKYAAQEANVQVDNK